MLRHTILFLLILLLLIRLLVLFHTLFYWSIVFILFLFFFFAVALTCWIGYCYYYNILCHTISYYSIIRVFSIYGIVWHRGGSSKGTAELQPPHNIPTVIYFCTELIIIIDHESTELKVRRNLATLQKQRVQSP